ncbi:MAG: hypothetical protein ABSD10_02875 [Candidatus Saccharimonadales bacterium]|jgi:hypothetical protein
MAEVSDKQLEANRINSKKGGVKTEAGKEKSKYNAVRHNILTELLSGEEAKQASLIKARLHTDYEPATVLEELLVERVAIWYVRLQRVVAAEAEQLKKINDPTKTETTNNWDLMPLSEVKIIHQGYEPKIKEADIELLGGIYLRYETEIERNLFKAIRELLKAQEARKNGFVSEKGQK